MKWNAIHFGRHLLFYHSDYFIYLDYEVELYQHKTLCEHHVESMHKEMRAYIDFSDSDRGELVMTESLVSNKKFVLKETVITMRIILLIE